MTFIQEAGSLQVLRQRASHVLRTGVKACLLLGFATMAHSQSSVPGAGEDNPLIPLAQQTDQQIGSLLQRWPELDAIQRRDLLAEVRKRMHLAKKVEANVNNTGLQNRAPSLTLRIKKAQTQHRYGRVSNSQRQAKRSECQDTAKPIDESGYAARDGDSDHGYPDPARRQSLSTRANIGAWHAAVSIKRKAARIRT